MAYGSQQLATRLFYGLHQEPCPQTLWNPHLQTYLAREHVTPVLCTPPKWPVPHTHPQTAHEPPQG